MIADGDSWQTPQKLWDALNKQYNFFIDCCASKKNNKRPQFFDKTTPFETKLTFFKGYKVVCWMNPPFSKAYEMFEHFF